MRVLRTITSAKEKDMSFERGEEEKSGKKLDVSREEDFCSVE
jgi:hypothetical protein